MSTKASLLALAGLVAAIPKPAPEPQIHLPPTIPRIPGVTVPLDKNAPPLPIAQVPTPAVPSPKHKLAKIKPRNFAYWAVGAMDREHSDWIAGTSLDNDTFGQVFSVTDFGSSGNEPHHSGPSYDGKVIWAGGLLSLLKAQNTGYYFDVSDYYKPKFMKSDTATLSSIADDVVAKPDGGFFFTYMGSAVGTSPGRLVETDAKYNIIHQWPEDVEGLENILGKQFSPHGLNVDFKNGYLLTSDFVVPRSVLRPSPFGVQGGDSLRLWDLKTRKIINTLIIPKGEGIQDVKFIPNDPESRALATAVGLGEVWLIEPKKKDPKTGKPGVISKYFDLGPKAKDTVAIFSYIHPNGKYAYYTYTTGNHIGQLDISDVKNPKRLDNPNEEQPTIGPHFLKVAPDGKHVLVCDYFLQTGDLGIVNTPADFKGLIIPINQKNGKLDMAHQKEISFAQVFSERGGGRPHSMSIYQLDNKHGAQWV